MTARKAQLMALGVAGLHLASVMLRVGQPDRLTTFLIASLIWLFAIAAPAAAFWIVGRSKVGTIVIVATMTVCALFYEIEVVGPRATPEAPFALLFVPAMQWAAVVALGVGVALRHLLSPVRRSDASGS